MEPLNIIIVEDEALLAMELESLVEDAGHRCVGWATSAKEAQALVDTTPADLAFIDVNLADGPTGVEIAEYIARTGKQIVVFLTANPKQLPEHYAGAVGVIAKPYTMSGLNAAMRYLQEGVRRPPPTSTRPVGFDLSPNYAAQWDRSRS